MRFKTSKDYWLHEEKLKEFSGGRKYIIEKWLEIARKHNVDARPRHLYDQRVACDFYKDGKKVCHIRQGGMGITLYDESYKDLEKDLR